MHIKKCFYAWRWGGGSAQGYYYYNFQLLTFSGDHSKIRPVKVKVSWWRTFGDFWCEIILFYRPGPGSQNSLSWTYAYEFIKKNFGKL